VAACPSSVGEKVELLGALAAGIGRLARRRTREERERHSRATGEEEGRRRGGGIEMEVVEEA